MNESERGPFSHIKWVMERLDQARADRIIFRSRLADMLRSQGVPIELKRLSDTRLLEIAEDHVHAHHVRAGRSGHDRDRR